MLKFPSFEKLSQQSERYIYHRCMCVAINGGVVSCQTQFKIYHQAPEQGSVKKLQRL